MWNSWISLNKFAIPVTDYYIKENQILQTMEYSEEMYRQKLREFFERHDKEKLTIVDDIAEKFPNDQEAVFKHLTALYSKKEGTDDIVISNDSIFSVPTKANTGVG